MSKLFRCGALTLALLLVGGSALRADNVSVTIGGAIPSTTATYTFDNGLNNTSTGSGLVGPFFTDGVHASTVYDTTTSTSIPVLNGALFCVDLWHEQTYPANYSGTTGTVGQLETRISPFATYDSNLGNKLNYLGYVYNQAYTAYGNNSNLVAAIQLVVWSLIDTGNLGGGGGFSLTATNPGTALTDYTAIKGLFGSSGQQTIDGVSFYGFLSSNSAVTAYQAEFFLVDRPTYTGQDTMTWALVPDPSTMAIAALGALGMIGYGLRRRKSS